MGAWGYEIFDDDTTCDIIYDLRENEGDIAGYCEKTFDSAISTDYLDAEEGSAVAVCSAIMDGVLKGTTYSCFLDTGDLDSEEQFADWINGMKSGNKADFERLKDKAVQSLTVLTSEKSELYELWSENEEMFPKWKEIYEQMRQRLKN